MIELAVFAVVSVLYAVLAYYLFNSFDMFKASITFALMALLSSALFAAMDQDVIAILQLLVFVGGISVYLMVGVASNYSAAKRHSNAKMFVVSAVLLFAVFSALLYTSFTVQSNPMQFQIANDIQASFGTAYLQDGLVLLVPFCATLMVIAAMKRVAEMIS